MRGKTFRVERASKRGIMSEQRAFKESHLDMVLIAKSVLETLDTSETPCVSLFGSPLLHGTLEPLVAGGEKSLSS